MVFSAVYTTGASSSEAMESYRMRNFFYKGFINTKVTQVDKVSFHLIYRISSVIRRIIFLPKQSQRSRSILKDGSRSLGLFGKGKIGIIAKFHTTVLII